jgi:hypothetical protein
MNDTIRLGHRWFRNFSHMLLVTVLDDDDDDDNDDDDACIISHCGDTFTK